MRRLGHRDAAEAVGPRVADRHQLQLVLALLVEEQRPARAVDLDHELVLAPGRDAAALERADRAVAEGDRRGEGVIDVDRAAGPLADEGGEAGGDGGRLADEVTREVDDVRAEIAERAGTGLLRVEPPARGRLRVDEPRLQVAGAEVADLAKRAVCDQLPRELDGREEAVVEAGHVDDAGALDRRPDRVRLLRVAAERLLAEDVLAGARRGDRRRGVEPVRAAVGDEVDRRIVDQLPPVEDGALVAELGGHAGRRVAVAGAEGDQPHRHLRRDPRQLAQRDRVRTAHEAAAEHADADRAGAAALLRPRRDGLSPHHATNISELGGGVRRSCGRRATRSKERISSATPGGSS